ncbi:hypothetical protein C1646_711493 [Rhizophagus diaphanus]|nr:hypothetical protein C1646_711493 [Rhizophagus diaphanus] [Rhizophagus sp. MUCL 43196]
MNNPQVDLSSSLVIFSPLILLLSYCYTSIDNIIEIILPMKTQNIQDIIENVIQNRIYHIIHFAKILSFSGFLIK